MEQDKLETILGRPEYSDLIDVAKNKLLDKYKDKTIFIYGANGSLGNALLKWLKEANIKSTFGFDIDTNNLDYEINESDITNIYDLEYDIYHEVPDIVFNFAAAKHAPEGEEIPCEVSEINITGVSNLLKVYNDAHIVLSSTCKSCIPETTYGATKLIADRMVMNAGGSVARYFNVVQSSGNVFEIWENTGNPYFVTDCKRFFISIDEAIALTIYAGINKGRFAIDPGTIRYMPDICSDLYGDNNILEIPRRRGDRIEEPLIGSNEEVIHEFNNIYRIINYNDKY